MGSFTLIAGGAAFLFFHWLMERIVCGSGNRERRKLLWNLGWAAAIVLGLALAWVLVLTLPGARNDYGTALFLLTPVLLLGALGYAQWTRLAYENGDYRVLYEDGAAADETESSS